MEICVLKLDGSHTAEDALKEQLDAKGDRNPWLYDVGVVARPLIGRVRIVATFPDGNSTTFREGDLTKAVGELGAHTGYYLTQLIMSRPRSSSHDGRGLFLGPQPRTDPRKRSVHHLTRPGRSGNREDHGSPGRSRSHGPARAYETSSPAARVSGLERHGLGCRCFRWRAPPGGECSRLALVPVTSCGSAGTGRDR